MCLSQEKRSSQQKAVQYKRQGSGIFLATLTHHVVARLRAQLYRQQTAAQTSNGNKPVLVSQVVNLANTTSALASAPNPSVFGQSVTFTATVSVVAPGAGTPTGSVTFYDNGTSLSSGTLSGSVATCVTNALTVGMHIITATYSGSFNFTSSASSGLTFTVINGYRVYLPMVVR
jgi:hypothetical protein